MASGNTQCSEHTSEGEKEGALRAFPQAMLTVGLWLFQSMPEKKKMRLKKMIKTPVQNQDKDNQKERGSDTVSVEMLMHASTSIFSSVT